MEQASESKVWSKKNIIALGIAIFLAVAISFLNVSWPWFIALGLLVFSVIVIFILKQPFIGVLIIALSLPFERIGAYEFGETTIRISQIILVITMIAWFINLFLKNTFKLAKNPLLPLLAVFAVINIISLPGSLNLGRSVIVLAFIIFTMTFSFIVPNLVNTPAKVKKLIMFLLLGFFVVSIFGLWQFLADMSGLPIEVTGLRDLYTKDILGFTRVQSTAYEPLYFANYLLIPLGILFALFLSGKGEMKSTWVILLFGLGIVNFILTVSRGGYIAIAVTLAVVGAFYFRKLFSLQNILIFLIAIVIVGWVAVQALGVGGELFTLEKFQEHIGNAFYGASYDERVETISSAMTMWQESPLVGSGPGSFGPYMANHPFYVPTDGWRIVNNEFIEILAENGIIGLFIFILIILLAVIRSFKAILRTKDFYLKAILIGLLGAFIGVLAQYQTFSTLYIVHVWFLIGLIVAIQNIILLPKND
ncbi:O-antigen ligase family protein [Patescibacteria group bacterium]|nr:O-antigen ligase family protein [Patescibacteria group bacterium]MBU0963856.1 O-antigen ligase family protein [Patescibacteria group bacterium]